MATTLLPTQMRWSEVDWDGAREMGFLPPVIDFVTAEDMTREREREGRPDGDTGKHIVPE